ncbi:Protein O-mannosyltransferase 2 [Coemansia asiatica]|uniref:Protein O-mannosyltransferase 2 n=1 Tax=Coemansia asiatica TaxID=1052880 RepID=A0A9W8CN08_9FUNG|nr:Protein O-mannosyltransferase 2 [Coemansia asiatica]
MSETNASIASRCHTLLIKSLPLHKLLWLSNIPLQASRRYLRRCRPHRSCHHISAALLGLTLVALAARLHGIGADNRVVWDETHFGRFATRYIKREFYLDVHPPLGKLLLMLVYSVFGYSGDFDFESGSKYPSTVPIAASRYVQALLGALLAPVSVLILQTMLLPSCFAWIAGIFVAMDNALIGISRIVVLDSMLLLTNALALYAFLCFRQTQNYTPEADHMGSEFVARLNNSAITLQYPTIHSGSFIVLRSAEYPFEYLSAYAANNSSDYLLATRRRLAVEDYWKVQGSDDNGSFDKSQSIKFGDHISLLIPKTPFHISILNQDGLVGLDKNDDAENVRKDILNYRRPLYDEEYLVDKSVPQQYQFRCVNQGRGALWNIEHHLSSASETPISLLQHISTGYSKNIFTYNRLMHELNGMLVSDPDQLSLVESHPLDRMAS